MNVAIILPRNMNFSPEGATAIDLCVHDFVRFSRYREMIALGEQAAQAMLPTLRALIADQPLPARMPLPYAVAAV